MNYNNLTARAHNNAVNHGFWENKESNELCLMLVITEIGELVNADRKGKRADVDGFKLWMKQTKVVESKYPSDTDVCREYRPERLFERFIKDTVEDEFADIAIRLFDLAGALGVDFDKMNPCRYYRAYDRFSFTENAFALCKGLSRDTIAIEKRIQFGLAYVKNWASS